MDDKNQIEENNSWNRLSKWDTYVDERIRSVIGDGNMSWHPKAGQPLQLDDDSHTPPDERLAYKIMKDNDVVPAWVDLGHALHDKQEKLLRQLYQYAYDFIKRKNDAIRKGSFLLDRRAEERWQKATRHWAMDVGKYNSELMNYNLQIPPTVGQRVPMRPDHEIDRALQLARDKVK